MLFFANDYSGGAHPIVLKALCDSNDDLLPGYCSDRFCEEATDIIRQLCGKEKADVFFFPGGTAANKTVIGSLLTDNQGVVCASTGHINTHEAGAVEMTGHRIIPLVQESGKISADCLTVYLNDFNADPNNVQMVEPAMVYISCPTEFGTLYSLSEIQGISDVCRQNGMYLYMDGARLGYGLASPSVDFSLEDISELCDIFYIGGTKMGALCGEAVVFPKGNAPKRFKTIMKQHGGLFAKGRLPGVQFCALLRDSFFIDICKPAVENAILLGNWLESNGYRLLCRVQTNQVFVVLDDRSASELAKEVEYRFWYRLDKDHIVARFVTSWETKRADVESLIKFLALRKS